MKKNTSKFCLKFEKNIIGMRIIIISNNSLLGISWGATYSKKTHNGAFRIISLAMLYGTLVHYKYGNTTQILRSMSV